jgi:hypothetical protein
MENKKKLIIISSLLILLQSAAFVLGADCSTISDQTTCDSASAPNCFWDPGYLPPITGSCKDLPSDCTEIKFYSACWKKTGCKWDVTGPSPKCISGTLDCSIFTAYLACKGETRCHWDPDPSPGACKSGSSDPAKCIIYDETICTGTTGCTWNNGYCQKTSTTPTDCTTITDVTLCINTANCYWNPGTLIPYVPGKCQAASTTPTQCNTITNPTQCYKTTDCTWDMSHGQCIAGTTDCSLFTITACNVPGVCKWDNTLKKCVPTNPDTSNLPGTCTTSGGFITAECPCSCKQDLKVYALYKKGDLPDEFECQIAKQYCHEKCARNCGGNTTCAKDNDADCGTCCQTYCSGDYGGTLTYPCQESCSSTCSYRGLVNSVVQVIYAVAGVLGALFIIINGLRIVTSEDPNDRTAAKRAIIYVIIALIIIILAATLVGMFMNSATTPQGE